MEAITQKDLLNYKFLSAVRFAPGGERAAFVVANSNEEENCYERRLWLYEDGALRQLTDLGKEGSFLWLDERRLIFPAVRSAKEKKRAEAKEAFTSYYVLDVCGGEALPYMTLPFSAESIRLLDEDLFLVTATVDKKNPLLWQASDEEKEKARKEKEEEKDYEVFTELPFWSNGAGVTNGNRTLAFLVNREPLRILPLMKSPEDLLCHTVFGDEILLAYMPWQVKFPLLGFCLRAVNWKTAEVREVLDNWELRAEHMEVAGGKVLLMATTSRHHGLNENAWVYTLDPADGAIVPLYNGINPAEKLSIEDVQNFYHISNIGYQRNLEGHIFQISSDAATGTVEWVAINDNALSVFVPYYPMLTTDVYEGYKLSTAEASFVTEAPESGVYYPTTKTMRVDGERKAVDGFMVLPENWADSIYWVTDALSNTVLYCTGLEASEISAAYDSVYALQAKVNADFFALDPAAVDAESATQWSADQAKALHEAMLALANDVIK